MLRIFLYAGPKQVAVAHQELCGTIPFLGGGAPNYADYIALGAFLWVASVSTLPMLARTDTLRSWIDRGFDLYAGLGRDPRMNTLFE